MRFTVRYIPLSMIKPDPSLKMTNQIKKLRRLMWDCMNIVVVKRNRNDGSYSILTGLDRYEHLKKNEKNIYAPCIVDESTSFFTSWIHRIRHKQSLDDYPMVPKSWSIVKSFLKQEPRFENLSRTQQLKVLILAVRYKKTVVSSMKKKVDEMVKN